MRGFIVVFGAWVAIGVDAPALADDPPPNVVLIYADDLGYADLGCYGAPTIRTPNLDRMAREGIRFTDFHVAQAVCSASRAALLTGCYPNRVGILGALGPSSAHGIHEDEITLAELVKARGYATAIFGKWHLGHHPKFLPTRHGFDSYYGLPYSNDMWPGHPESREYPDLPLFEGERVVNPRVTAEDQAQLTTGYTERAVRFIEEHKARPFFLYVPQSMPHVPLFASEKHRGKSRQGLYGDVIEEIDWSVGEILSALREHGLDERTLVIFSSDNGPWLSYGDHAGDAGGLREGKGTTWDGCVRVPMIARWPGTIPAGSVCREPAMTIDLFPTIAAFINAPLPRHPIDGLDIRPLLLGQPGAKSPHDALFFYWGAELQAVRSGKWKLHLPHAYRTLEGRPGHGGQPGPYVEVRTEQALYDLEADPSEKTDVLGQHPEIERRLMELIEEARTELGDSAYDRKGKGVRPSGQL